MSEATAIAVAGDGKILVGGNGARGATIMRLQATGQLDTEFGNAGATTIDLPSESRLGAADTRTVCAARRQRDRRGRRLLVICRGRSRSGCWETVAETARVCSASSSPILNRQKEGEVVVTVRRTGGSSGPVSVAYRTAQKGGSATGGEDYEELEDRLHWADGDVGEREITVSVLADDGAAEEYENFGVSLSDAEGGAGIGTRNATVSILADGSPAGQFAIDEYEQMISETGVVQAWVYRNYYYVDGPSPSP